MKKILKALLISAFVLVHAFSYSQGYLKADGQRIVNARGENVLLRGIGLGGWMLQEGYMLGLRKDGQQQHKIREKIESLIGKQATDEFYEVWLQNHTTKADIDSLKSWGFNSVRLPMHYNLFTLAADKEPVAGENTWLDKGFRLTDSLLSWCRVNEMYLILDLHAAPAGQGNDLNISDRDPSKPSIWEDEASRLKTIALWKQIAIRYANEPWVGGYDIINEPNFGFKDPATDKNGLKEKDNKPLKQLLVDITQAIRMVDNNHLVIIEGNGWGNNYNGILDEGLWDKNMALSFHKYWNYNDEKSISHILDYRSKYNVPVWLGETGENSNVWFTQAIALLEKNNIGWAWWPLKKTGNNNPLQVKTNINYNKLLKFWNGEFPEPPKESEVYGGLLELATYTNIQSNIVHHDVIDAMMRQPHDVQAMPFKIYNLATQLFLPAVDYDLGRNGIAYLDMDTANYRVSDGKNQAGNRGRMYRNDGVDIYQDSSTYDEYYVGDMAEGEWLQYTVNVPKPGMYTISLKIASIKPGASFSLSDNGKLVNAITIPSIGNSWKEISTGNIQLASGIHRFRIKVLKERFIFSGIRFSKK